LSGLLKRQGVKHSVLNAKYHEKEAEIIAQAGSKNAVTIATNMAGRGTDILLGGNPDFLFKRLLIQQPDMPPDEQSRNLDRIKKECDAEKAEVLQAGGLHILGTERHESRRIDNQLRGRAGRQGDPGSSRFYLALEDDLMRIFGSERISGLMQRLGMEEGIPIEHRMVSRAIENAQKKVEAHNFDIRKQLLEYDDVMNKQRAVIYEQRRRILRGESLSDLFHGMMDDRLMETLDLYCSEDVYSEEWDLKGLSEAVTRQFMVNLDGNGEIQGLGREALREKLIGKIDEAYKAKEAELGEPLMRRLEKMVMLRVIDTQWKDHLLGMDYLKEGIGLRGYGQKDPLVEYKREGFEMFAAMMERIKADAVEHLFKIQVVKDQPAPAARLATPGPQRLQFSRGEAPAPAKTAQRDVPKVGRNDPCPCGSGKKYKKCHGQ
jgi:preprotein translocase subunit SecA